MDSNTLRKYVRSVESRISPGQVAMAHQGAESLKRLPLFLQRLIVRSASRKDPYMGFVVEPYSFFLAYEIEESKVASHLPPDYELIPISLFEGEPERFSAILGGFNIHTSVFWGTRFELYVIAKNRRTGLASWIICDYESNTVNYDPGKGFLGPTTRACVFTTTHAGEVVAELESLKSPNRLSLVANILSRDCLTLNQRLWVEGNLSVDYYGELGDGKGEPFGLIFDPAEMGCAFCVDPSAIEIRDLSFGFLSTADRPFAACCFPFAQHYVTTTFLKGHEMKDAADLERRVAEIADGH